MFFSIEDKIIKSESEIKKEISQIEEDITQIFQRYAKLRASLRNKKIELLRIQKTLGSVYVR